MPDGRPLRLGGGYRQPEPDPSSDVDTSADQAQPVEPEPGPVNAATPIQSPGDLAGQPDNSGVDPVRSEPPAPRGNEPQIEQTTRETPPTPEPPTPMPTPAPSFDCGVGAFVYRLWLYDAGGDGWQGATYAMRNSSVLANFSEPGSIVVASGTLGEGFEDAHWLCLVDGCFECRVCLRDGHGKRGNLNSDRLCDRAILSADILHIHSCRLREYTAHISLTTYLTHPNPPQSTLAQPHR